MEKGRIMIKYSIMKLDENHLEEICQDVKLQYETGVADCVLFMFKLVPEGNPPINKAEQQGQVYKLFKTRLDEMNIKCGVLVQCSIGHGYALNKPNAFQPYVNLNNGESTHTCCPFDEGFQEYIKNQMQIIASLDPEVIMLDDDFRMLFRVGKGCACPEHMRVVNELTGEYLDRETLYNVLKDVNHKDNKRFTGAFVESQRLSLIASVTAMREGIDAINPKIQGVYCATGPFVESASEIARIFAGKSNPTIVRIGNGNYPANNNYFSRVSYGAAQQSSLLKGKVDYILSEGDTCPQNRYSVGAYPLHAHMVASILEGTSGVKYWITRLRCYEPDSGVAYRKMLARQNKFYDTLVQLVDKIEWQGCRIPLSSTPYYYFEQEGRPSQKNSWSLYFLEKMGFPVYFSNVAGGASFIDGETITAFTNQELIDMLSGTCFVDSNALIEIEKRGLQEYCGVVARRWEGENPSYEKLLIEDKITNNQPSIKQLVPLFDSVTCDSTTIHLENDVVERPIFPALTCYKNKLGGRCYAFCGVPKANFNYIEPFSFQTESRKKQFIRLLSETGNLPIYFVGDDSIYLKSGIMKDGRRLVSMINLGFDPTENIKLYCEEQITKVSVLNSNGTLSSINFDKEDKVYTIDISMAIFNPVILVLETK